MSLPTHSDDASENPAFSARVTDVLCGPGRIFYSALEFISSKNWVIYSENKISSTSLSGGGNLPGYIIKNGVFPFRSNA